VRVLLTLEEGVFLVRLARTTIAYFMIEPHPHALPSTKSKTLNEPRSVFVSLKEPKEDRTAPPSLRGCIGFVQHPLVPDTPYFSLLEATQRAAISSAFRDPRFSPIQRSELESLIIEVSVLTVPEELVVPTRTTLIEHITIGVDGLIIESGRHKGLLLPQVAPEQGWNAKQFLKGCCRKAGLPPDKYLDPTVKVSKFQAQIFVETSPGAEVVERKF
jgi:uncharacterized protein (TIGR00296 family)